MADASALPPAPPRDDDPRPAFQRALSRRAAAYAERELRERGYADVLEPDRLNWAVSTNRARTRRVADIAPVDPKADETALEITLTWQYYTALEWDAFATAIRHELVHAVEYVRHGSFTHGPQFRQYAADFDTAARLADLVDGVTEAIDHRYRVECQTCGFATVRDRASRVVKHPETRRCPDCGAGIRVRHCASGRTWTSNTEYRSVRGTVEADPDLDW